MGIAGRGRVSNAARWLWAESEKSRWKPYKKAGVEITHPDKTSFIEKVQPLIESYKSNPAVYSYIGRIRDAE